MQTLEQIYEFFAEENYSWTDEADHEPWEFQKMISDYINDLKIFDPEWEQENQAWESWYARWYKQCLIYLLNYFKSINTAEENWININSVKLEEMIERLINY